jgi:hypothetical protein
MFREAGDLHAPRRRRIGPELLAALSCIRTQMSTRTILPTAATTALNNDELERSYNLITWDFLAVRGELRP